MTDILTPRLCVIGAGAGGLSVAAGAAMLGVETVLIEKGEMGGDCLNYGCVPSKALIAAAARAHAPHDSAAFGVDLGPATVDFARVRAHLRAVIAAIAPNDSVERFEGLGVRVIRGTARFVSPHELEVNGQRIRAGRFVIATGSTPAIPPIPGLEGVPFLTNETLFELATCPRHLVIIGGGPIGCEMAQAFRRLGAAVTVVSLAFLEKDDPELGRVVLDRLQAEGVRLMAGASVLSVAATDDGPRLVVRGEDGSVTELACSHLLVATGRRPAVEGLGLDRAGVAHSGRGITVDARLRTGNRRIYAVGDVTGRFQFTHMAGHDAGIVIRNLLFRLPARIRTDAVPWVTFTDPELAQVGLTEAAARAAGHQDLKVLTWPFHDNDRAQAERRTEGLVKLVATRRGRILGCGIVGPHAGELIQPWALALSANLKLSAMAGYIAPYPTLGEASKRVAGSYFTPALFSPWMKRLVSILGKFG